MIYSLPDTEISAWTTLALFLRQGTDQFNTEGLGPICASETLMGH